MTAIYAKTSIRSETSVKSTASWKSTRLKPVANKPRIKSEIVKAGVKSETVKTSIAKSAVKAVINTDTYTAVETVIKSSVTYKPVIKAPVSIKAHPIIDETALKITPRRIKLCTMTEILSWELHNALSICMSTNTRR